METIVSPWLVQRGTFKSISENEIDGINSIISYDYMSSSEFECGALFHALSGLIRDWDNFKVYQHPTIRDLDNNPCYFITQETDKNNVIEVLNGLAEHKYRLKQYSGFDEYLKDRMDKNFWWAFDVDFNTNEGWTQWMACFGKHIKILKIALEKSYQKKTEKSSISGISLSEINPIHNERELYFEEDRKAFKIKETFSDRETILIKFNILEVMQPVKDKVNIKIKTQDGSEKWINIACKNEKRRNQLIERIEDQILWNKRG